MAQKHRGAAPQASTPAPASALAPVVRKSYSVAEQENEPMANDTNTGNTSLLDIDEQAKAQAEAEAANQANGAAPEGAALDAETTEASGIKKQVSFMCPVELMVLLEEEAIANYSVKTDAKGHTNISGPLLDAAVRLVNKDTIKYVLTPKEKASAGVTLTDEEVAAKKAAEAAARKAANDKATAAAAELRARLRAKAQEQLSAS